MSTDHVTIERLTLQIPERPGVRATAFAAQSQVERFLHAIDWRPSGYRPSQVWVIRRLAKLPPLAPDGYAESAWLAAAEGTLEDLYRRALRVRPGGALTGVRTADSLLFEDRADWLALLTAQTLSGHVWEEWCWSAPRTEAASRYPGVLLASAWSRYTEHLPAALELLAPIQVQQAIALLLPAEVGAVVRALHERFVLPEDVLAVTLPEPQAASSGDQPPVPWRAAAERPEVALTPQAVYLHGLLRMLSRAPGVARSRGFAQASALWLHAALRRRQTVGAETLAGEATPTKRMQKPELGSGQGAQGTGSAVDAAAQRASQQTAAEEMMQDHTHDPLPTAAAAPGGAAQGEMNTPPVGKVLETLRRLGDEANTTLGGVLFLIHALRWLNLPEIAEGAVGPWAWLEVFGRLLAPGENEDSIWRMLRNLDGREAGRLLGQGWRPTEFRLPPHAAQWEIDGLGDTAELERYTAKVLHGVADRGVIWFAARVLPYLVHLLHRALHEPHLTVEELGRRVLQQAGRVEITRTHVDLFLPLAAADARLRRAGLDANPGWQPAYGYIVTVHYG